MKRHHHRATAAGGSRGRSISAAVVMMLISVVAAAREQAAAGADFVRPSRPGEEASYEGYLKQYGDPGVFTPIGPPSDPAETAVSPGGQLMYGNDRYLSGTAFMANALVFALEDQGRIVPLGTGQRTEQSLMDGHLPIVITNWQYGGLELRETAFARPLRDADYTTGLESTLAWAVFDVHEPGRDGSLHRLPGRAARR